MMKRINPLLSASIFYIIGNALGQGMILLGTIIFTRMMSQDDYGTYSTYYSLVSILTSLVGANLFISLNNAYIDYKKGIYEYRASVLFLSTIIFIALCGSVCLLKIFFLPDMSMVMLMMALVHAYAFFVVNYFNYSANMENKYKIKTLFLLLPNILQIVLSVIFIIMLDKYDLEARIFGSTLGVGLCAVYVYIYMMRGHHKLYVSEYWKYGLSISIPSILSSISYMLMQQSDKIMITKYYSASETAVYSLVYNIGFILYALWQATSGIIQVWLYRALDENNLSHVKKVQKWYLFIFMFFSFVILMVSPEIIKILAPQEYWNFGYIAPFVLASSLMVMYGMYTIVGLFYKESFKVSLCVLSTAVINIGLNRWLIPIYGGIVAAYTSVIAYIILFFLCRALVQKYKKGLFSLKYFVMFFGGVMLGCLLFSFIYKSVIIRYLIFMILLLICLVYMWINKQEWIGFVKESR